MRRTGRAAGARAPTNGKQTIDTGRLLDRMREALALFDRVHEGHAESEEQRALIARQRSALNSVLAIHATNLEAFLTAVEKARERELRAAGAELTVAAFTAALENMRATGCHFECQRPPQARNDAVALAALGPTRLGTLIGETRTQRLQQGRASAVPSAAQQREGLERAAALIGGLLRGDAGAMNDLAALGCDRARLERASSSPIAEPSAMKGSRKRARALAAVFLDVDERALRDLLPGGDSD